MKKTRSKVLIIGAGGFIGSFITTNLAKPTFTLLTPSSIELNILDTNSLKNYFQNHKFDCVINTSGFANMLSAEKERNNKKGIVFRLNSLGPKKLAKEADKYHKFLIHISTDAVFPGTIIFKGPYSETQKPPARVSELSWYAYTKLLGEINTRINCKNSAIIRISYPFGYRKHQKDYLTKTIINIKTSKALFDDFFFTPTYFADLIKALNILLEKKLKGTFHVTTKPLTTPYQIGLHLNYKLNLVKKIKKGSIYNFLKQPGQPKRNIFGGLDSSQTEERLGITFSNWKKAVDISLK
jgi:dTDP-4-dehydrorhamnose reductase